MSILFSQMKNEQDGSRSKEGSYLFEYICTLKHYLYAQHMRYEPSNKQKYTCSQAKYQSELMMDLH